MSSNKKTSSIQRLVATHRDVKAILGLLVALLVIPAIGAYLLVFTEGQFRAIGLGLFVYAFALFVMLPALILAANDDRGSNSRLFAAIACFMLAFFTFFYLTYTSNRTDAKLITTIPISVLGVIFFGWWAKDCMYVEELPAPSVSKVGSRTSLENLIFECDSNFGPAPRRFSQEARSSYLDVEKPDWVKDYPDEKLGLTFREMESVFRDGDVVWGHIIQANSQLFQPGDEDAPGELVYSLQNQNMVRTDQLAQLASRLFSLKGTAPTNPELGTIADYLADEHIRVFGLDVPSSISVGTNCKVSTTMFFRKHLPNGKLSKSLLPVVVAKNHPHVALILPAKFWPDELIGWWNG